MNGIHLALFPLIYACLDFCKTPMIFIISLNLLFFCCHFYIELSVVWPCCLCIISLGLPVLVCFLPLVLFLLCCSLEEFMLLCCLCCVIFSLPCNENVRCRHTPWFEDNGNMKLHRGKKVVMFFFLFIYLFFVLFLVLGFFFSPSRRLEKYVLCLKRLPLWSSHALVLWLAQRGRRGTGASFMTQ